MMRLLMLYPAWAAVTLLILALTSGGAALRIAAERLTGWQKFLAKEIERRRA